MSLNLHAPSILSRSRLITKPSIRPNLFPTPKPKALRPTRHASSSSSSAEKIDRVNSRLPRFLRKYTTQLRSAPLSHITSFLLLHELTAILPLFTLAGLFHYYNWLPPFIAEWKWVNDGIAKFGNYFRRKGWLGDEDAKREKVWGYGEGGVRLVVEFATAYALTKALLPLRLVASVSLTPWFARICVVPCRDFVKRLFSRAAAKGSKGSGVGVAANSSPAAGTNAVGGGVLGGK